MRSITSVRRLPSPPAPLAGPDDPCSAAAPPGESPSVAASPPIVAAPVIPGIPLDVRAVAGDARARLSWSAPLDRGGGEGIEYVVRQSDDDGVSWSVVGRRAREPRVTVFGLVNGRAYRFRVAAANRAGVGEYSPPTAAVVPVLVTVPVPGPPGLLSVHAGPGMATLRWTPPAGAGEAPLAYVVEWSRDGGTTWKSTGRPCLDTQVVLFDLDPRAVFRFRVAAYTSAGRGPWVVGGSAAPRRTAG